MGRMTHMAKRIDLSSRVDEATTAYIPIGWDLKIARAMVERREQLLTDKSPEAPATGTELIQARLAEARARADAEAANSD